MLIKRQDVASKVSDYLHHKIQLSDLEDRAERAMMEGEFEPSSYKEIREAVALLGLADVHAFGLTWDDAQRILGKLGYQTSVEVTESE
ncbi:hypothetical protein GWO43_20460 [candidate division KSB1 bacterium]|nr:hypothetical protein [candidate division KSB1 bacterium]NIR71870.1 hypothetical protein [candidate division KSB1 bacterium]NIS26437.1 hypothetical protein [candidate division KSB1 bacterium]NIT73207.1 hypothetical protein [candidate division KSB1 bacterium]NIU27121.1 hypothetical protein [candidate division KSB1 bacterium]